MYFFSILTKVTQHITLCGNFIVGQRTQENIYLKDKGKFEDEQLYRITSHQVSYA